MCKTLCNTQERKKKIPNHFKHIPQRILSHSRERKKNTLNKNKKFNQYEVKKHDITTRNFTVFIKKTSAIKKNTRSANTNFHLLHDSLNSHSHMHMRVFIFARHRQMYCITNSTRRI